MAILRNRTQDNFTMISNNIFRDKLPDASERDRWIRSYNLGAPYSDSVIERRIRRRLEAIEARKQRRDEREANKAAMTKAEKIIDTR